MEIDFEKLDETIAQASSNIDCPDCKKLLRDLENSLPRGMEVLGSALEILSKHLEEVDHEALSAEED